MEKIPQFIREFSKEESKEERKEAAEKIKAKRSEHFSKRKDEEKKYEELDKLTNEREKELFEKLESIRNLENRIEELSTSKFKKLLHYFELKKIQSTASSEKEIYGYVKELQDSQVFKKEKISEGLNTKETPPELREAEEMLSNFYEEEKEKWENSEYAKEDITKYFSEDNLTSLSLEEYSLLLKRFPSEMVTHVTRQGIRDHTGHMFHTVGQGEYTDGFMKMVEDGRLRSALGIHLIEKEKEKAIAEFLGLENCETKEEAIKELEVITGQMQNGPGSYADSSAIHFATEEVADCYYGSEKGNEIFVAFPSAHIASQYYFSGQLNEKDGGYWNDQWVWANEEKGMDLNAGIIFIPAETKVDKKTGSRYELDEKQKPIKNEEYKNLFKKVVNSEDFEKFAEEVMEISGKLSFNEVFQLGWNNNDLSLNKDNKEIIQRLETFRKELEEKFNIDNPRLQLTILSYNSLFNINVDKKYKSGLELDKAIDETIESTLEDSGILYKESKNTVDSKDFWENYFKKNPDKKPSKIVYYKGIDPTQALLDWRKKQGIDKEPKHENIYYQLELEEKRNKYSKDKNIGFPERNIERGAPQAIAGINRFKSIAEKVIEDYFNQKQE
jgi:hypothetical protein